MIITREARDGRASRAHALGCSAVACRQLRDRRQVLCGNVDDVELTYRDDQRVLYATAILSGPGRLARRMGRRRVGDWLVAFIASTTGDNHDPSRIPFRLVQRFGPVIDLAVDDADLAAHATERWVGDHVISHIPGKRPCC